jgi:hypothetical protein
MNYNDDFVEIVITDYDDPISSLALRLGHVRSYVANPTWQNYDETKSS